MQRYSSTVHCLSFHLSEEVVPEFKKLCVPLVSLSFSLASSMCQSPFCAALWSHSSIFADEGWLRLQLQLLTAEDNESDVFEMGWTVPIGYKTQHLSLSQPSLCTPMYVYWQKQIDKTVVSSNQSQSSLPEVAWWQWLNYLTGLADLKGTSSVRNANNATKNKHTKFHIFRLHCSLEIGICPPTPRDKSYLVHSFWVPLWMSLWSFIGICHLHWLKLTAKIWLAVGSQFEEWAN